MQMLDISESVTRKLAIEMFVFVFVFVFAKQRSVETCGKELCLWGVPFTATKCAVSSA